MRLIFSVAFVAVTTTAAAAQYSPGDLLFAHARPTNILLTDLFRMTPAGTVNTAAVLGVRGVFGLTTSADNREVWCSTEVGVLAASPTGAVRTITPTFAWTLLDLDGDGTMVSAGSAFPSPGTAVFSVTQSGITTLGRHPSVWLGAAHHDRTSGDILISNQGLFVLPYRGSSQPTQVSTATPFLIEPCWSPETESLVGALSAQLTQMPLRRPYSVSTLWTGNVPRELVRTERGALYVVDFGPATVFEIDAYTGSTIRTVLTGYLPQRGMEFARSRHAASGGTAARGQQWPLRISFPREPGAFYVAAVSLQIDRGFPVGNGYRVFLKPDPLFNYSLTNSGNFSGFQGVLDSRGEASASLMIPSLGGLVGTRVFAQVVAMRNGLVVGASTPLGVTIL